MLNGHVIKIAAIRCAKRSILSSDYNTDTLTVFTNSWSLSYSISLMLSPTAPVLSQQLGSLLNMPGNALIAIAFEYWNSDNLCQSNIGSSHKSILPIREMFLRLIYDCSSTKDCQMGAILLFAWHPFSIMLPSGSLYKPTSLEGGCHNSRFPKPLC
jgi:hypothetical protein